MRVRYSPRSVKDIDNIRSHITKDDPKAAWIAASFIRRSIGVLEEWPYHGRATDRKNVRRLVVMNYPYVVYYHVGKVVLILTVMHSAQDR